MAWKYARRALNNRDTPQLEALIHLAEEEAIRRLPEEPFHPRVATQEDLQDSAYHRDLTNHVRNPTRDAMYNTTNLVKKMCFVRIYLLQLIWT